METMDDIVKEFLVESYENLDRLDQDLVALEDVPDDREKLASIFRTIHTIKGTSGFLAFPKLEQLTHVGENLLVLLRDGQLRLNNVIASGLLALVDAVRRILASIEAGGVEGDEDFGELMATLEHLKSATGADAEFEDAAAAELAMLTSGHSNGTSMDQHGRHAGAKRASQVLDYVDATVPVDGNQEEVAIAAVVAKPKRQRSAKARGETRGAKRASNPAVATQDVAHSAAETGCGDGQMTGPSTADESRNTHAAVAAVAGSAAPASEHVDLGDRSQSVADSTVRIDVGLLDKLMNLVGELVLARNQILQYSRNSEDAVIVAASQRLNLITAELQEGIMKTRMQPIQNAWSRLPRVVRDLSAACGKKVQVKMEGAETELDKTILEAIKDPLTHIVRNAVDHGIEPSAVRSSKGKSPEGTLSLRAFHEGGQVNIEISDDGAGIDLSRVKEKALHQGLISAEQAATMTERELTQLILLPGFSTAARVTNVSGRGVGMDVVKTNVEKIGGTLDIQSVVGQGTTMRIKIPLTLAIVPGLTVTCGGDCYCIPQASLLELVRLEEDQVRNEIEQIHHVPVYRLRGNLLPLLYLDEQLGLRAPRTHDERCADDVVNIVVLQAEDKPFGLVVDSVTDMQEIVVKPLGMHLKGISAYAGATIMGDGAVSLILDVAGLARAGNALSEHRDQVKAESMVSTDGRSREQHSWLIVDPGDGTRAAISLGTIARLEEFHTRDIERCGSTDVVQYRGQIMPLVRLSGSDEWGHLSTNDLPDLEQLPVVVFQSDGRQVGVIVGQIVDIVEHSLDARSGGLGQFNAQIICGRVTRVIDLGELVGLAV